MKKLITSFILAMIAMVAIAQTNNTIKFLGIPVDGKKSEMVSALMNKGFIYDGNRDVLTGKFNGIQSIVYISENYGKVDRVIVADETSTYDEANIRIRYNNLISQFEKLNERYYTLEPNEPIPDDEDISYEIRIHNKRYQASFYYHPIQDEELAMKIAEEAANELKESVGEDVLASKSDEERQQLLKISVAQKVIQMTTGFVWFTIIEQYGKLSIAIYYENEDNRPNGEEL